MTLPDGEIDLLAEDGHVLVAVEVRTTTAGGDPIGAVDYWKRNRVKRLAVGVGAKRVDFVGVRIAGQGVDFHWVQN